MMRLLTAIDGEWVYFDNHDLANAVIASPCPIYRVEVLDDPHDNIWRDVTGKYDKYISKRKEPQSSNKGDSMKGKIVKLPLFAIGEVIDLSYKYGGMPNRIYVNSVFWRESDIQWNYQVTMENTGEKTSMSESFIKSRRSKNSSPVCENPDVIERFKDGWRFCGNFDRDTAIANGKLISENDNVHGVRLYDALNYNNRYMNGKLGVWIKYKHMIDDNGRIHTDNTENQFISIK